MTEKAFMSDETHATLDQAIAAARGGRRDDAARMMRQIVADDPFNVDAWIWLGGLAADPQEQRSALEQALMIAPDNQRAQQGLDWMREMRPELFTPPVEKRPVQPRKLSPYEESLIMPVEEKRTSLYDVPVSPTAATFELPPPAQPFAVPPQAKPAQAMPTQAVPAYQSQASTAPAQLYQQTDRMSAFTPISTPTVDHGRTDRMAAVPPPTAAPQVLYRRSPVAGFARWMVLLTWIFSFGAVATFAALLWAFPSSFESALRPILAIFNLRLVEADIDATRLGTALTLSALAIVDLMMILGLLWRGRWSWVLNALIATLVLLGSVAVFALAYVGLSPFTTSGFLLTRLPEQILTGLLLFSMVFFALSLASRRAFFRRPVDLRI